ncbi:hypothetical protein Tfer_1901 [Thermincola ferriacetica]|uniref:RNA-binding protein n=2 Tax=Thermincola TaxID=278993 RepID=D5XAA5_THEPJ|nr:MULTISPECIES: KOW domain-containing RNA-binding protein [Thermincola]ADG81204.1 conserved hypothetical protein [Thermincola potens JR]KNZ69459.1 hypothetical protein Tfer_1901 [Thermincola ferriacetica]
MSLNEPGIGQLVKSKAGRDKKRFFIIYDVLNEAFVRVVDGDCRKVENPKKKNLKHLQLYPVIADGIKAKLAQGKKVDDAEVRRAIEDLVTGLE